MDEWKTELIGLGAGLLADIVRDIIEAIAAKDPSKLTKVGDVLPAGPLKARLAFIAARMQTEQELSQ